MKITIFIIVLVLKSNKNMKIWHFKLSQHAKSSKPCKNSLFQDVFKLPAPCSFYIKTFQPMPNTIDKLKKVLQTMWDDLPQSTELHQQAYTEFCRKTSILCESDRIKQLKEFLVRPLVVDTMHIVWWGILFWATL